MYSDTTVVNWFFFNYLKNCKTYRKNILNTKCALCFSLQCCLFEILLVPIHAYIRNAPTNPCSFRVKYIILLCDSNHLINDSKFPRNVTKFVRQWFTVHVLCDNKARCSIAQSLIKVTNIRTEVQENQFHIPPPKKKIFKQLIWGLWE